MSNFIEVRFKSDLKDLVSVYINAFPHSYSSFNKGPVDFDADLNIYANTITNNYNNILSASASGIQKYCNLFGISPINGVDEFKTIYFLGRAIEKQLLNLKNVRVSQIHMYTMIGLMDEKLNTKKAPKPELTHAMLNLIDQREFDNEMGKTGCYFTYKCSSTSKPLSANSQPTCD